MKRAALTGAFLLLAAPVVAGSLVLSLPIDCELGKTCFVQHHVDRDPGPTVQDFQCGDLSYDGHKGTDFALVDQSDMARGVNVLASATGRVIGVRDGVTDRAYRRANAAASNGRECGNGVILRHPDGWQTQYCHMKSGSIRVKDGQTVAAGTILGQVGLSGRTQFPHVHLSVRKNGKVVDPYAPDSSQTCGTTSPSLWESEVLYTPADLISIGFSDRVPSFTVIKNGTADQPILAADAKGLVLFAYIFGGRKGDILEMRITGPNGPFLNRDIPLEKDQAQLFRATGKRLKTPRWPAGSYSGAVRLMRGPSVLGERHVQMTIK